MLKLGNHSSEHWFQIVTYYHAAAETCLKCYMSSGLQLTFCCNNIPSALDRRDTKRIWQITVNTEYMTHSLPRDLITTGLCSGIWVFTKYPGFSLG